MNQLYYIYIQKCRNLNNIGISIINSFTAIIGNNGAGKSNIIRFIVGKVTGNNDETSKGLVIWKDNDNKWHYSSDKQENLKIVPATRT